MESFLTASQRLEAGVGLFFNMSNCHSLKFVSYTGFFQKGGQNWLKKNVFWWIRTKKFLPPPFPSGMMLFLKKSSFKVIFTYFKPGPSLRAPGGAMAPPPPLEPAPDLFAPLVRFLWLHRPNMEVQPISTNQIRYPATNKTYTDEKMAVNFNIIAFGKFYETKKKSFAIFCIFFYLAEVRKIFSHPKSAKHKSK